MTLLGTASRFPARRGTQNEWITSAEVSVRYTGRSIGMCISLAVVIPYSG